MEILVFGLANENSLLAKLRKRFPSVGFKKYDLSQELENEDRKLVVIDTVRGISSVTLLDDLQCVSPAKALEGSGTLMTLRILLRIGSIESVKVIAVPEGYSEAAAFEEMSAILEELLSGG
jgi:hypothetical protein